MDGNASGDCFFCLSGPSTGSPTATLQQNDYLVDRVPVGNWRSLELELSPATVTLGGSDTVFIGTWESYDPATDKYVQKRTRTWHVRVPPSGDVSIFHDRVPHLGDFFSMRVKATGMNVVLGECALRHTNRDQLIVPPSYETFQGTGVPGAKIVEQGDVLLSLVARSVGAGLSEIWDLPPYRGPAYVFCYMVANCVLVLYSRAFDSFDAASPGVRLMQLDAKAQGGLPVYLPPRINSVYLLNATAGAQSFEVSVVPALTL